MTIPPAYATRITLTAAEVSDLTGLGLGTIRERCRSGDWPASKVGREWLILAEPFWDRFGYEQPQRPRLDPIVERLAFGVS